MPRVKASLLLILTTFLTVAAMFMLPYTPKHVVRTMVAQKGEWMRSTMASGVVSYGREDLCISPRAGRISKVYVQPGQQVKKGEVLFLLDTSMEEQALQAVYQTWHAQRTQLLHMDAAVSAMAAQQSLQWREQEQQLIHAIESAQIRAEMDGVAGMVYVGEGDYVEAAGLLGSVHNDQRCVIASAGIGLVEKTERGTLAALEKGGRMLGAAEVAMIHAPTVQDGGMQRFTLIPFEQDVLSDCGIGDVLTVELLMETIDDCVPIPISAVDAMGRVWYVEDGRAYAQEVNASQRNAETIAAGTEWEGRSIILLPENLHEGCLVKEAVK